MAKILLSRSWLSYTLIALAGVMVYAKTLAYDLVYLDDNVWILDYQWFLQDVANGWKVFLQPDVISEVFYRPVLNLSFILNAQFSNTNPMGFRCVNILLHVMNACLVFNLLSRLGYNRMRSLGLSLLFVVHPVLVQAVVWIPGRTDTLLAFFILCSFISFLSYFNRTTWWSLLSHLMFWALALLTKETAVVMPALCLFYFFIVRREDESGEVRRGIKPLTFGWLFVAGGWFLLRSIMLYDAQDVRLSLALKSVFDNAPTVISYVGKVLWPFYLAPFTIPVDTPLVYGVVSVIVIVGCVLLSRQRRLRYVVFAGLWFTLFLLPSLVISFLNHEYRVYLPLIGCCILFLELMPGSVDNTGDNSFARGIDRWMIGVFLLVVLLAGINLRYSGYFHDRLTYWQQAVVSAPHAPLAHRNLGAMYYLQGDWQEAQTQYNESLSLNPGEPMVHNNLGLIYAQQGQVQAAEQEYLMEIKINPEYANVYFNLGMLYYQINKQDQAVELWKKTVELEPAYVTAYLNLATFFYMQGDMEQAKKYAQELYVRGVKLPGPLEKLLGMSS